MKKIFYILAGILLLTLTLVDVAPEHEFAQNYTLLEGRIKDYDDNFVTLKVTNDTNESVEIEVPRNSANFYGDLAMDEQLVVQDWSTSVAQGGTAYNIEGYVRRTALYWIFGLFVVTVVSVMRWQGLRALCGLTASFIILFRLIFPLMLRGFDPLWTAILGCFIMIPIMFYLTHGFHRKTSAAIAGTMVALVISGLLAWLFGNFAHLTGLSDETAIYLKTQFELDIDFQRLLMAGILISMLGVLDDVSISQASVVHELYANKKTTTFAELFERAMQVGKDHIGSMVNTLVLIFAGASLPMLMIFMLDGYGLTNVLNYEFVAADIVQTFAASIGLILTVPLATFFAILSLKKS